MHTYFILFFYKQNGILIYYANIHHYIDQDESWVLTHLIIMHAYSRCKVRDICW